MAGKNIKGITISIDGETTGLTQALSDVNKRTKETNNELREIDKLLKFNPGNTELLAQKQQLLAEQIGTTTQKLDQLKGAQQQVEAQFARGEIGEAQYRAFQRELVSTEDALNRFESQLSGMQREQQKAGESTQQLSRLFEATGTNVDQFADSLGTGLTRAIKNGTATSAQLDRAIEQIGRSALGADTDIGRLRTALGSIDDGRSIDTVRQDLGRLSEGADEAEGSVKELGSELTNLAAGAAAGGGLAGVIESALDVSSLDTQIEITMDLDPESVESVKSAVKGVSAYGVDAEEALAGVRKQWALNKDASDAANTAVVEGAATIAASYAGIDFNELIQETNEIAKALNVSNEEALGLTNALLEAGFPPEQLDIIAEYGTQLQRAGYDAEEIKNIMSDTDALKSFNIDSMLDGLKEGRIRAAEFGDEVPKALDGLLEKTDISSKQMQEWGKAVAAGGEGGKNAMSEMAAAIADIDDETTQNAIGAQVYGTIWEDQGSNILGLLTNAGRETSSLAEDQAKLNENTAALDSTPAVKIQEAFNNMKTALAPLLVMVADLVAVVAGWMAENPKLTATIVAISTAIGILVGLAMGLAPIITAITGVMGAVTVSFSAVIGPILAIVAGIGLLIAAGVAIYQNWDEISAKTKEIWEGIKEFLSVVWEGIKEAASVVWEGLKSYFSTYWEDVKLVFSTVWEGITTALSTIWEGIKTVATVIWDGIKLYFETMLAVYQTIFQVAWETIKTVVTTIWEGIKSTATIIWEGIKSFFTGILDAFVKTFTDGWNNIKTTTTNVFEAIKSFMQTIFDTIKSNVSAAVGSIKDTISRGWETIKSVTSSMWESIKSLISNAWSNIKSNISTVAETIRSVVSTAWNNIKSTTSDIFNAMKSTISDIWGRISSSVSNTLSTIVSAVRGKFDEMRNAVSGKMQEVLGKVKDAWNQVMSFLRGINLRSMGRDIIQGLVNGIKSMASTLVSSAKGVVKGAIDAAKNLLGIRSPSRVFMQIGKDTGEGMQIGMNAMMGRVAKAGEGLASAAIPEMNDVRMPAINAFGSGSSREMDLARALNALADRPVILEVDGREIARASYGETSLLLGGEQSLTRLMRGSN